MVPSAEDAMGLEAGWVFGHGFGQGGRCASRHGASWVVLLMAMGNVLMAQQPRIGVAGMLHESNTYSEARTGLAEFERDGLFRGEEIIAEFEQGNTEISGYIEGAKQYGLELYPAVVGWAVPSGRVTDEALDVITAEMIRRLKRAPRLDGLLLALHGAMVAESYPAADAEVVRRLREAMGAKFPKWSIHFTQVTPIFCGLGSRDFGVPIGNDRAIRGWVNGHSLLHQPVEELAAAA